MISAHLDKESMQKLNQNIGLFVRYLNVSSEDIVRQTTKQIADAMTHSTPPYVINPGQVPTTTLAGKKRGEERIRIDILKIIKPVQDVFGRQPKEEGIAKLIRRRNTAGMTEVLSGIKGISNPKIIPFTETLHTNFRGSGRYRPKYATNDFTWDRSKTHSYVKQVQSRVGYSKSGWHMAAVAYGAKPIEWLARHFSYTKGWFIEDKRKDLFATTMSNTAPELNRHRTEYNKAIVSLGHRMLKDFEIKLNYLIKTGKLNKDASA
jgi:hypothetical protein